MKRVTGIGGIFFNAKDPVALRAWYTTHLGIDVQEWGGAAFRWSDEAGRNPGFAHPLLCPSVLHGIELERLPDVESLPAFAAPPTEPWIYDGRVVVRSV